MQPSPPQQMQGTLLKQQGLLNRYHKKHFVLEGMVLKFGKNPKKGLKHHIDLNEAYVEEVPKKKYAKDFRIYTPSNKIRVRAETEADKEKWFSAL